MNRWSLTTSYAWSRFEGNFDLDILSATGALFNTSSGIQDSPGRFVEDRFRYGPLSQDRPHVFKLFATYEPPVIPNLTVGGYLRAQSGTPWAARGIDWDNAVSRFLEPAGTNRSRSLDECRSSRRIPPASERPRRAQVRGTGAEPVRAAHHAECGTTAVPGRPDSSGSLGIRRVRDRLCMCDGYLLRRPDDDAAEFTFRERKRLGARRAGSSSRFRPISNLRSSALLGLPNSPAASSCRAISPEQPVTRALLRTPDSVGALPAPVILHRLFAPTVRTLTARLSRIAASVGFSFAASSKSRTAPSKSPCKARIRPSCFRGSDAPGSARAASA